MHDAKFEWTLPRIVLSLMLMAAPSAYGTLGIDDYNTRNFRIEQGMPSNSVTVVAQTPDGYLWIGTQRGLARYDGQRFTTFDHITDPQIVTRYITALAVGIDGKLLMSSRGNGVFQLRQGHFVPVLTAAETGHGEVFSLLQSRDGSIWCATNLGVFRRQPNGVITHWTGARELSCDQATSLIEDRAGMIWVGTCGGVVKYDGKQTQRVAIEGLDDQLVFYLLMSRGGVLYAATMKGAYRIQDGRAHQITPEPETSVWRMAEDRDGSIWIATWTGLLRLAPEDSKAVWARSFLGVGTAGIFEDQEKSLWVASHADGLFQLRETLFTAFTTKNGLPADQAYSVATDSEGRLMAGVGTGAIVRLRDGRFETVIPLKPAADAMAAIWTLAPASDGTTWAAPVIGAPFAYYDGKIHKLLDRRSTTLLPRPDGTAWIVSRGGGLTVVRRDGTVLPLSATGLPARGFSRILPARDGGAWVATIDNNLFHVDNELRATLVLKRTLPYSVLEDPDGTIWVGTLGAGIVRLRNGKITEFHQSDGLLDDDAYDMVDDGYGYFWIATNAGISRISRRELESFADGTIKHLQPRNFGLADGLLTLECNGGARAAVRTADGMLWFATPKGLLRVDPDPALIDAYRRKPIAIVESVSGDWIKNLRLSPKRRPLTVNFTAPTFINPEGLRFQYKMEGLDPVWIDAGRTRSATYTNLPHGRYRFAVRAFYPADKTTGLPAVINLEKVRAFYETYWFRGLLLFVALTLCGSAYRLRIKHLQQRQAVLERTVEERTTLLAQANHSLKRLSLSDPLTGIANRRCFDEQLENEWRRAERARSIVSLLFIDVDFFKKYNDAYGHQAGDACLIEVANSIAGEVHRPGDLAARYGGEEFSVILANTDETGAWAVAEAIRARLAAAALPHSQSTVSAHVTLSIGLISMIPPAGSSSSILVELSDQALYQAKASGRNQVFIGTDDGQQATAA